MCTYGNQENHWNHWDPGNQGNHRNHWNPGNPGNHRNHRSHWNPGNPGNPGNHKNHWNPGNLGNHRNHWNPGNHRNPGNQENHRNHWNPGNYGYKLQTPILQQCKLYLIFLILFKKNKHFIVILEQLCPHLKSLCTNSIITRNGLLFQKDFNTAYKY